MMPFAFLQLLLATDYQITVRRAEQRMGRDFRQEVRARSSPATSDNSNLYRRPLHCVHLI
jgi:hypothetical protein